jgi:very-short-patch-repair endonuclease
MLSTDARGIARAKSMRRRLSLPEALFWRELRAHPGGFKFRRQHGAGRYTLDFYCHEAAMCIEVDGIAHDMGDNPQRDAERDAWLNTQGIMVLRLPATLVLQDMSAASDAIVAAARRRSSP